MEITRIDKQLAAIAKEPRQAELMRMGKFELTKYEDSRQDWEKLYTKMRVKSLVTVFEVETPSLASLNKYLGELAAETILFNIVKQSADFVNVGKNMNETQILMTCQLIMNKYSRLTIADFKLFFNKLLSGDYGGLFDRFDGQLIMVHLATYWNTRLEAAQMYSQKKHSNILNQKNIEINKEAIKRIAEMFKATLKKSEQKQKERSEAVKDNVVIPGSKARMYKGWDAIRYETEDKGTIKKVEE